MLLSCSSIEFLILLQVVAGVVVVLPTLKRKGGGQFKNQVAGCSVTIGRMSLG